MKKLTTLSLLAAAVAAFSGSAFGQIPTSSSGDDLVLAFDIDDGQGTGASTDLEVDLGSYTQFTTTSTYASLPTTGLNGADLISTYGANWATRGDLVFNVTGNVTPGAAGSTVAGTTLAYVTQSGTPQADTTAFNGSALGNILQELTQFGNNATPTGDSTESGTVATSLVGSLNNEDTLTGGQYGYFNETAILNSSTAATEGYLADTETAVNGALTTIDLYSYSEPASGRGAPVTNPTLLGTFELTSGGTLTYTGVDAAPEPSTWALMLGGAGLLFVAMRRRWISNLS